MTKPKTPLDLQRMIIADVNWFAGPYARGTVAENDSLASDFRLTKAQVRELASPFTATVRRWKPGATITRVSTAKLGTIGDAVKLVSATAGFDGSWATEATSVLTKWSLLS